MKRVAAWFGLPLLALSLPSFAADADRARTERETLDRDVPGLLEEYRIPSVSIAQIENGRLAFAVAYGRQSDGVPATTGTLYNIASLTKPLSAETVLRLASTGAFTLDEPLDGAWTDPDIAADERRKRLSVRITLSHQTGFPNWRGDKPLAFSFAPGTGFGYSGEGYEYVARFVQKKTGENFPALAESRVFAPLGMRDTSYLARASQAGRIAVPTTADGKALEPQAGEKFFASDLVHTTPTDYAKFVAAVMRDDGLAKAVAAERRRIQVSNKAGTCQTEKARAACPDDLGFGLGWEVSTFGGKTFLMHTGKDPGIAAFVVADLAAGDATILFTNSDNGFQLVLPLLERLGTDARFVNYLKSTQ